MRFKAIIILNIAVLFLSACSETPSPYTFPHNELTSIHRGIMRAHSGISFTVWGANRTYFQNELRELPSDEFLEVMGQKFEEILIGFVDPDEKTRLPYFSANLFDRIEMVPGLSEVIEICTQDTNNLRGDCLWENWSILSNTWEELGRTHTPRQ